ncbi:mechanosensitive ion channel [Sulfitobacter sp. M220]|nr:mechanosensitive ion channel domain-containing protein [Sulfitobacter sp. M220]MCF7779390.1 mechanosensitive ion channel [Sulfitobacter sp. M220]
MRVSTAQTTGLPSVGLIALCRCSYVGLLIEKLPRQSTKFRTVPISRQRITNYSAPKRDFRSQVSITLDHVLPIGKARDIMLSALSNAKLIQQEPKPDIRVQSYEENGICYTVRYWVPKFELAVDCRDEVFSLIDEALRDAGSIAPYRRIQLINAPLRTDADQPE